MVLSAFIYLALTSQIIASDSKNPLEELTANELVALSNSYIQNSFCVSVSGNEFGILELVKFRNELFGFEAGYKGYHLPEAISAIDKITKLNNFKPTQYSRFRDDISTAAKKKLRGLQYGQPYMINNGCSSIVDEGIPLTCHVLSIKQQVNIDDVFQTSVSIEPSENGLLKEEISPGVPRFTEDELKELKKLAHAQGMFESYIGLQADLGGWKGNEELSKRKENGEGVKGKNYHTVCGHIACIEEATNTHEFIRINYGRKNLKYFEPGTSFVHRDRDSDPLYPSHYATEVINSRTGERLVIDSWLDDGAMPARVIPYSRWKKEDDVSIVRPIKLSLPAKVIKSEAQIEYAGMVTEPLLPLTKIAAATRQQKFELLRAYRGRVVSLSEADLIAGRYTDPVEHESVRDEAFIALETTVQSIKEKTAESLGKNLTDDEYLNFLLKGGYEEYATLARLVLSWDE